MAFCFIFKLQITALLILIRFYSFYHSLSFAVTHCHFLLLFVIRYHLFHSLSLVIIRCHSLSFVATRCTTRCHSLSFVVTRCHSLYHSLPLVVIRCHSLYHLLSLDVPLVCLFINDLAEGALIWIFNDLLRQTVILWKTCKTEEVTRRCSIKKVFFKNS